PGYARSADCSCEAESGRCKSVADRDGERVGRMMRCRQLGQTENDLHHALDLRFLRASVAADRLLDRRGRVLGALEVMAGAGDEHGAPSLPDEERGAGVDAAERLLERPGLRSV